MQTVRNHQRLVEDEEIGDLLLVGLQLIEGRPDIRLLRSGIFQLDHRDRQTVDEAHQVRPAQMPATLDGELIDHQKAIAARVLEIDQPHPIPTPSALAFHLDRHAVDQRLVESAVALDQRRMVGLGDVMLPPRRGRPSGTSGFRRRRASRSWVGSKTWR
jgi:hypothetical protein